ncbi:LptF/LptG family permease [Pseudohoeflea suaedae]|uniref:LptF/LptG family permease n=1 Tax=Pseudohoeflea suaedae TaxID=877384 RepID=A0A4R5PPV2_9HYPH|nr:LptF/LptG family permease [Pseudohoeflea suaedae]TDH38893.1 LptF/LptG family permease [Pseudohoeflea suaedae]
MREFEGYLFRRMAVLTFWSLVSATLLVLTTQVLLRLNILTSSEQALLAFGKITIFLIPSVLSIVAPFALLIGITQVLNGMNSDSELVVMESAGAGQWVVLRPILALSVLISALTFASANVLEPRANRAFGDTLAAASADLLSLAVRKGSFQRLSDGLYVHIDEMFPGGEFGGIFLSDRRSENTDLVYFANRGRVVQVADERFLVLAEGQAQQRDTKSGNISIVTFDSYALDLSSFLPSTGDRKIFRPREQSTPYLLNPPEDDFFRKRYPGEISKEVVERMTGWLYPLAFGFLAFIYMGKAVTNRQEKVQSIVGVVGGVVLLRAFGFYSAEEAGQSTAMYLAAFAVPVAATAISFLLAATGATPRMPSAISRRIAIVTHRVTKLYEQLEARYRRKLRREAKVR